MYMYMCVNLCAYMHDIALHVYQLRPIGCVCEREYIRLPLLAIASLAARSPAAPIDGV